MHIQHKMSVPVITSTMSMQKRSRVPSHGTVSDRIDDVIHRLPCNLVGRVETSVLSTNESYLGSTNADQVPLRPLIGFSNAHHYQMPKSKEHLKSHTQYIL